MRPIAFASFLLFVAATTNPADLYKQAFDQVNDAVEGERTELNDVDQTPLNEKTAQYLREREPVINLLRDAAKLPPAEVADPDGDMGKTLPSLNKVRHAALLVLLQARMDLQNNKPADAAQDCLAAIALTRNVGQQKLMVARLVEFGTEAKAIDTLLAILPSLPKEAVQELPAKLAALPKPPTAAETMAAEFKFGQAMMKQQQDGEPAAFFDAAEPFYRVVAAATTQPAAQFDQTVDAEAQKLFLNPFVKSMAQSIKPFMRSQRKIESLRKQLIDACTTRAAAVSNGP